ncbi:MAG TPA: prolyl oligopeptidase family serine peptidase, partial [Verrucomicrobiae bacterium]|nr:prolyl oligopeptidase family serine peptidase [Verrucomicrobiae bacterium]
MTTPINARNTFRAAVSLLALMAILPCSAAPDYPPARRDAALDDYNGIKVADPYRWMEQLDSPETRQWVEAEARLTYSYLEKIPVRKKLQSRIKELLNFEKFGIPFHKGNRYFYTYNSGLQQQGVLYVTDGLDGKPGVAFDPNPLSANGAVAIAGYVVSPNGKTLAYGVSQGGSDWTDWRFRDIAPGRDLPDVVKWTKYYQPVFSTDGSGVYYSAFPAPAKGDELRAKDLGNAVYFHHFGTSQYSDRKLFDKPEHPDWQFEPHLTFDGQWLIIRAGEGEVGDKGLENLYAINLKADGASAIPLAEDFDADYIYSGADHGLVYLQTTLDAPRGRVIAVDPASPARANWKEVIRQTADALDVARGSVTLVDHQLIVCALHDAASSVKIYGEDGQFRREVALPGHGTAGGFDGEANDRESFYTYTDLATPPTIFRIDLETGESEVYRSPKIAFDTSVLETRHVFYPAKDGTKIPMSLVYKKGIKLDESNPTILYGYGGFGISILPGFDATRLAWLERGGIYAQANIRGGGEYGDEWHRQAIRAHKQIVFDDFIAAAEWLIAQGYTSTPKL